MQWECSSIIKPHEDATQNKEKLKEFITCWILLKDLLTPQCELFWKEINDAQWKHTHKKKKKNEEERKWYTCGEFK